MHVRGPTVRRALGHGVLRRPPPVPDGGVRGRSLPPVRRGEQEAARHLPLDHPTGGGHLARRGIPRRDRLEDAAGRGSDHRDDDPATGRRRAPPPVLGGRRPEQVHGQAGLEGSQAHGHPCRDRRRPRGGGGVTRSGAGVPAPAAGASPVGRRPGDRTEAGVARHPDRRRPRRAAGRRPRAVSGYGSRVPPCRAGPRPRPAPGRSRAGSQVHRPRGDLRRRTCGTERPSTVTSSGWWTRRRPPSGVRSWQPGPSPSRCGSRTSR